MVVACAIASWLAAPQQGMASPAPIYSPPASVPAQVIHLPDLVVTSIGVSQQHIDSHSHTAQVTFSFIVRNNGNARANQFLAGIRLAGHRGCRATWTMPEQQHSQLFQALEPGQQVVCQQTVSFNRSQAEQQTASYAAAVDTLNVVRESNESNNVTLGDSVALDDIAGSCIP